jgi:hypothetical protein
MRHGSRTKERMEELPGHKLHLHDRLRLAGMFFRLVALPMSSVSRQDWLAGVIINMAVSLWYLFGQLRMPFEMMVRWRRQTPSFASRRVCGC